MTKGQATCRYCGHIWVFKSYSRPQLCDKRGCGSKDIQIKRLDESSRNVFGYPEDETPPSYMYNDYGD